MALKIQTPKVADQDQICFDMVPNNAYLMKQD